METPRHTLTFISPFSLEVAQQHLTDNTNSRPKLPFVNKFGRIVIEAQSQDADTAVFSMICTQTGRYGFLRSIEIPNPQHAIKAGERRYGKVKGTLQRRPDGTTLVNCQFYWGWSQAFRYLMEPLVLITSLIMVIGLMLLIGVPLLLCFGGFIVAVVFVSLPFMWLNQTLVRMRFMFTLKRTLGYEGHLAALAANQETSNVHPPYSY